MYKKLLQKAMLLSQQLEQYEPLDLPHEKKIYGAADALVKTLEEVLLRAGGSKTQGGALARLEAFELVIRPFFQKILPQLAILQNQFSSSQSWFAYRVRAKGVQEVFTLGKLQNLVQSEPYMEQVMLVSQMKTAKEKESYSARVTLSFVFDGPVIRGSYKIESPFSGATEVKIETFEDWYRYDDARLDELVTQVGKEIRKNVLKSTY